MTIKLVSVNYSNPLLQPQPKGGIVESLVVGVDDAHGDNIAAKTSYADARAMYFAWKNWADVDIIGFHGYRKHINFRDDTVGWTNVSLPHFRLYQEWLARQDGAEIEGLLAQHDIIVTPPFDCSYNIDMTEDFRRSRSPQDWEVLQQVMSQYNPAFNFHLPYIHNMFFVCRMEVFHAYMKVWWAVAQELEARVKSEDSKDAAYTPRALAFLSERIFSIWLHSSGLKAKELPLLLCWDAH